MRDSIFQGKLLPESLEDFQTLLNAGKLTYRTCKSCENPFEGRTTSPEGWRDTQIIGWCERCYDDLMKEGGDATD